VGEEVKVGDRAPNFQVVDNAMQPVTLDSFKGKVKIISCVPSLDTPVCDMETRRFNEEAGKLPDKFAVLTVSMDLPFAQKRWCAAAGVEKVKTVKAVYEQKEPYSDEDVEKILNEALRLNGGTHGYAKKPKTLHLLLQLMLETGLRVGDAVGFDPSALERGDSLWIYTYRPQKQKRADKPKLLEAYITDELKRKIFECEWLSQKRPFWYGSGDDPKPLAQAVYERMQSIGASALGKSDPVGLH